MKSLKLNIVGSYYYPMTQELFEVARQQQQDNTLRNIDNYQLIREPTNKHDSNAIKVEYCGVKVGYINRSDARVLAKMIDWGIRFNIDSVDRSRVREKRFTELTLRIQVDHSCLNVN